MKKYSLVLSIINEQFTISERGTQMFDRVNSKYVIIVLIGLIGPFFVVGASSFSESQSNGRFQLVVRHADSGDVFVIDTATGQVWTNKHTAPGDAKVGLYQTKFSQDYLRRSDHVNQQ